MKRLLISLMLTLAGLWPMPAQADVSVFSAQPSLRFNGQEGLEPRLELSYSRTLNRTWGVACLSALFPNIGAAAYCGPTYRLTTDRSLQLAFGVYVGIETHPNAWRLASTADLKYGSLTGTLTLEYGASGFRHQFRLTYDIGLIVIGVASQRFDGEGVYLEADAGPGQLFVMFLYDIEGRVRNEAPEREFDRFSQITGYRLTF